MFEIAFNIIGKMIQAKIQSDNQRDLALEHQKALENIKEEFEAELRKSKEELTREMENVKERSEEELDRMRLDHKATVDQLKAQIADLTVLRD